MGERRGRGRGAGRWLVLVVCVVMVVVVVVVASVVVQMVVLVVVVLVGWPRWWYSWWCWLWWLLVGGLVALPVPVRVRGGGGAKGGRGGWMSVGCRGVGRGRWRTDRLRNFPPKNAGCRNASCIFFDVREGRFVFLSGGFFFSQSVAAAAKCLG